MSNNVAYESLTLSHPFMFGKIAMDKKNSQIILSSLLNEDIIFICTFDPFGEGLYRYTFQNRCDENTQLTLGDECIKIFYNTKGD